MVTVAKLLNDLPPYRDEWEVVVPGDQSTSEIVRNVLDAHKKFARYYDSIAYYFDNGKPVSKICEDLYKFCKANIEYREESPKKQTGALPTGLLTRQYGDCKHYSGFCAGVLDALKRSGRRINWFYRFASYRPDKPDPHHVFVVVNDNGQELWIDPVPGAELQTPSWTLDKKVKS